MEGDTCPVCGGDRRISNAFGGSSATCPACHGTGRCGDHHAGFHDVTKTKPSHYRPANTSGTPAKKKVWPESFRGKQLATEVRECADLDETVKAKLIREIIVYEEDHPDCTKTFIQKIRKQLRRPVTR